MSPKIGVYLIATNRIHDVQAHLQQTSYAAALKYGYIQMLLTCGRSYNCQMYQVKRRSDRCLFILQLSNFISS